MEKIDYAAVGLEKRNLTQTARIRRRSTIQDLGLFGVAATACGTTAAILSVPYDPLPAGALFWSALWCTIGLLTVPLLGLRNSTQSVFRSENLLMLGLVYWLLLDLLQGLYPLTQVSYDDVVLVFIAIGTIATGIWVGTLGGGWAPPQVLLRAAKQQFSTKVLFRAAWISFFLGMVWYVYSSNFDPWLMIAALGFCRWCAPWSTGQFGGAEAFLVNLKYFGYILPTLTILLARSAGWFRAKTVVSVVLSLIFVAFLAQEGGRRIIGVTVGAALVAWLLVQERIRPKLLIGGLLGVAVVLVAMEKMLEYRQVGLYSNYQAESEGLVHVDDNFLRLAQLIDLIPRVQPYLDLEPLTYFMALPIPRVLWPGKPIGPGYDLPTLIGEPPGTSLTTSIIGELYAMHGMVVIFMGGLVIGRIAKMWNKLLVVPGVGKTLVYSLGVMDLFVGLRSMQDLVIMSYGLLGWVVIARVVGTGRRARQRSRDRASFRNSPDINRTATSQ